MQWKMRIIRGLFRHVDVTVQLGKLKVRSAGQPVPHPSFHKLWHGNDMNTDAGYDIPRLGILWSKDISESVMAKTGARLDEDLAHDEFSAR